jgi:BirA family biotin operon repressor/biotin-[acetyl-CoA-carboxylase] ligase
MQGEIHSELESTQLTLKQKFEENPALAHGYYVMAQVQTKGRGRLDNSWNSVLGNLHASVLLRKFPFPMLTWVPFWVAVAIHKTLVEYGVAPDSIKLKWPNDLWIEGNKKAAGILCEKKGDEIYAGIGLNLVQAPFPQAGVIPLDPSVSPEDLLKKVISNLSYFHSIPEIRKYYELYSLLQIGQAVSWNEKGNRVEGILVGMDEYGALRVRVGERVVPLYSEEVSAVTVPATTGQST